MVWLTYPNAQPAGSAVGTVDIDGVGYTLWFGTTAQTYIAYLANHPTTSVSNLNLLDFINDSVARGYFPNSWYLQSIEAGIETRADCLPFSSSGFSAWVNSPQCGNDPSTPTATPTPAANAWRIRCGGPKYVDSQGQTWAADTVSDQGWGYTTGNAIGGTSDPALYDDERAGNPFTYTFSNVPPGSYQVTLKFAEIFWSGPGQRVFNASINGTQVLGNFDIAADAGGVNRADDKVFNNMTPDGNGQITVQLGPAGVDNAKLSAIQVLPMASVAKVKPGTAAASPLQPEGPTPTPTLTPPASGRDFTVTAAPNISHGEPIRFLIKLPHPSRLVLSLFTLNGEKVYEAGFEGTTGVNSLAWTLQNGGGQAVASGLYLYRLRAQTARGVETRAGKVAVIR
jgi:hypothetical protein